MSHLDESAFVRAIGALGPYLRDLVVVGAWAHRLYRQHPLATAPAYPPLMTRDADLAAPDDLAVKDRSIADLLSDAGFREEFTGGDPPSTQYHASTPGTTLYVEFIVPLVGSGTNRRGGPRDLADVAGARAARLRYVDLMLVDPWELRLNDEGGLPVNGPELLVRVASPASYLAQKILSLPKRGTEEKRAKDLLYIADTLVLFGARLADLCEAGRKTLGQLHPTTAKEFHRLCRELPKDATLLRQAAEIAHASGRPVPPGPDRIAALCAVGLAAVFAAR